MTENQRIKAAPEVKQKVAEKAREMAIELRQIVEKYLGENPFASGQHSREYAFLIERYVTREVTKAIPKIEGSFGKVSNTQEYTRDMPAGRYRINGTKRILEWDGVKWLRNGRPYSINFTIRTVEPL